MTSVDTDVSNYTLSELMSIISVEDFDENEIIKKTNELTNKFKHKNPRLAVFFQAIQSQLLRYAQNLEPLEDDDTNDPNRIHVEGFGTMSNEAIYPAGERQVTAWFENQNLTQSDENQVDKITDRKQKIGVFGNQHAPMDREQIATTDTFGVPVKQDSLNPNLKNTISRFVNLDSQFRQYTNGIDSTSTDYTLDLSDTLKNALSLTLYSYQIPFSWYAIDTAYGNTCLWILDASTNQAINVSIPPGNYTQAGFETQLNKSFLDAGFSFPAFPSADIPVNTPVKYNSNSGIITLYLYDGSYNDLTNSANNFTINQTTQIIFYDFTGVLQCNNTCFSKSNSYFNNSLGWIMGYRVPYINIDPSGNTAPCILDLNGTKYLILVIDDYNQNHVNNSLVSISQFSNTLKIPSYYSPDIPYTCIQPGTNNLTQIVNEVTLQTLFDNQTTNVENGLLIAGKYEGDYTSTQISLPSAPRTLTKSQIYTINEINKSRNNMTNYLAKAPTTSDILAVIPVKTSVGVPTGSLLVEFSGSLQDSVRTYFGPVNIDRMAVKLLDDKGNVLNLNGNDWCVTLVCECLYQY